MQVTTAEFSSFWQANCFGAFLACKQVIPAMLEMMANGRNNNKNDSRNNHNDHHSSRSCDTDAVSPRCTVLFTGATGSVKGSAGMSSFAVGKFGLRVGMRKHVHTHMHIDTHILLI